jgi:hypothetical protein
MRAAICIGHSRTGDRSGGAVAVNGVSERTYNRGLLPWLMEALAVAGVEARSWDLYPRVDYYAAMRWLAGEVKTWGADVCVELHFNAGPPTAHGMEYLHWPRSTGGIRLARELVAAQSAAFPGSRVRHGDGLVSRGTGAGSVFLRITHCPAVITEPFFGSNAEEVARYMGGDGPRRMAEAYADGIANFWRGRDKC